MTGSPSATAIMSARERDRETRVGMILESVSQLSNDPLVKLRALAA